MQRAMERRTDQLRPVTVAYNIYSQADSSVLFSLGKTQVLCAITLQQGVPKFLRNKGTGWLTAEYSLLPTATLERVARETSTGHRDGRTVEISRVIGRTLRTCVDLSQIGEMTIIVDCDVLCADGGTRVASINAAALALAHAQEKWLNAGRIKGPFLVQKPAAIAIGVAADGTLLIDPDYREDTTIVADFNIIATQKGIIEIQGGAEKAPIAWDLFMTLYTKAQQLLRTLYADEQAGTTVYTTPVAHAGGDDHKFPLFSLKNRLAPSSKG